MIPLRAHVADASGQEVQSRSCSGSSPASWSSATCGAQPLGSNSDLPRQSLVPTAKPDAPADSRRVIVAGIYARYSSANQSPESCETQAQNILRELETGKAFWHVDPDARIVVPSENIFRASATFPVA